MISLLNQHRFKMFLSVILVLITSIFFFYKWINMRPKNFPPGPFPLPFIGSVYSFPSRRIEISIEKWSKSYGPTIGYMFGSKPTIFITGVENVLTSLRKEEFQGRPNDFAIKARSFQKLLGIFFSDGEHWQESRRFTIKQLRGFGKEETENMMKEEIDLLSSTIKDGSIVQGNGLFSFPAVNVIWRILSNKRLSLEDKNAKAFLNNLTQLFRLGQPAGDIVTIFPFMRFFSSAHKIQFRIFREIQRFMKDAIHEHKSILDYNAPADFIDKYLVEMEAHNKAGTNTTYSEEDLIVTCMDLFTAGAESTSHTIEFIIMYLILYPNVQEKLHEELDRVLQRSRRPNLDDKNSLPYTMAIISETLRINSIAPVSVPHRCTTNTTFNSYFIPKDTVILFDLWCLGYSTEYWKEPEKFDPSRFIDDNGQCTKYKFFQPFGVGKRVCAGEAVARNTIFLFLATFFDKYSVSLPKGDPLPSTEALTGFTTAPKPFRVQINARY